MSQGKTREGAIANARDAICEYVLALEDDQLPVPPERFEAMVVAVWRNCRVQPVGNASMRSGSAAILDQPEPVEQEIFLDRLVVQPPISRSSGR